MAISPKPQKPSPAPPPTKTANEVDVMSLINKGGSAPKPGVPKIDPATLKPMLVQLRLYPDLVEEIDAVRKATGKRNRPSSRHAWIVSAIEEKLARHKS
jgi:hypothetical protein